MGLAAVAAVIGLAAGASSAHGQTLKGRVKVDGSSTVAPITTAMAEMFMEEARYVNVTVGISGTGGGFKKFLADEVSLRTDINDASRPITQKEIDRAKKLGIEYLEFDVAIDGLAVMVNPKNAFCDSLTVDELKRIWEPGSYVKSWADIRPGFPDIPIKLYGPGPDSGTFDYFTEVICGKEKASRSDYTASEDDNVLVMGIAGDAGALGYFGYSYYEANKAKLKILGIDNGDGKAVVPNVDVVRAGSYTPLARPLFLYVNKASMARPEVRAFLEFYFTKGKEIVEHPQVNYVALPEAKYKAHIAALGKTGQ
jgi:phosphate transport system substrate-binding protein